ncbi:MAG: hypothetical protein JSS14_01030 [Proteobacteria bacterium]|nr:hypothetical protein [Pseudomonadota bacterium]
MPTTAPAFSIEEIRFFERDVVLRLPFRFGAATVTSCPQVYVRARIRLNDGSTSEGCAAEMMIPKWFDKNPVLSNEDNFAQLRRALQLARAAYTSGAQAQTAWRHFASHYQALLDAGLAAGLNPLVTSYGPALVDRALLDALCLHMSCSFSQAMSANLCGMVPGELAPDLRGFDFDAFAKAKQPRRSIAARHTVGLADAIGDAELAEAPRDGLPASLQAAIARYGHRHFKLKLCGDTHADVQRLARIAQLADPVAELVTLDGNEQYADAAAFQEFLDAFLAEPSLRGLASKCAFIEQPIQRATALEHDLTVAARRMPLLVDESDSQLGSFLQAQPLGYTGVSSKSCKGFYKSAINAARCAQAGTQRRLFLSGEDLTMQAGVGVQQDLALVGWLGLAHVERNGHHYVDGMAALPEDEQASFLRAHPALYMRSDGATRLRIEHGQIDLGSITSAAGFGGTGAAAGIRWDATRTIW